MGALKILPARGEGDGAQSAWWRGAAASAARGAKPLHRRCAPVPLPIKDGEDLG
ncbi:hypothetical protein GCM10011380_04670 [Sphingomonas metalli]|uniref:Uncharacterized protein n=1 Tax=Sphingomonas metalli TaxID=1779358 RepID=A0A916SX08_9SPHN|nr:hypothetical protein GCM10011380_04670 [Sphingomonas metalli]